jgi:hypothetical protein
MLFCGADYHGVGCHSLLHLVFLLHILKCYIQFDSAFNSAQKDVFDIKIYRRVPEKNNFYRMRCIEIRDFPQFIRKRRPISDVFVH